MKQVKVAVLLILYTGTLISANPTGTLNRETRTRFAKVIPEIRNVDLFWSKLSIEQQLQLKKSSHKGLNDADFQTTAKEYYYQTMPLYARIQLYTLEKWHALRRRLYPQKANAEVPTLPVLRASLHVSKPSESLIIPQELPQSSGQKPNFFIVNDTIKYHDGRTLPLSKSIIALIPLLDSMRGDFSTQKKMHIFLPADYPTLKVFISAIERIAALLQDMTTQTRARYNIEKQYAPDDIPAHVRDIIKQELQKVSTSENKYELFLILADYMGATYWADAVACLWMQSTTSTAEWIEQTRNLPDDVQARYIKKYADIYRQGGNYSTADLIFMKQTGGYSPSLPLGILFSATGTCTFVYQVPITSLTGFEFFQTQFTSKIKHLIINYTSRIDVKTIKPYTFLGLTNLQKLDLKRIGIEHIHNSAFAKLTKLTELMLYENKIKEIKKDMFMGLSELNYLSLEENEITSIEQDITKYLPKLQYLELDKNKLTAVEADVFSNNATPVSIDFRYNDIKQVQPKAFAHMQALQSIKLSHNYSLSTLPGDIVEGSNPNEEIHITISTLSDPDSLNKTLNNTRRPDKKVFLESY